MELPFEDRILEKNRILQMRNEARQETISNELEKKHQEACTFQPQITLLEDGRAEVTGGDKCHDLFLKAGRKYKPKLLGQQAE